MGENRTIVAVSSSTSVVNDNKCATTELKIDDDKRSESDGLNLTKTILSVNNDNASILTTPKSNKLNLETHRKSLTAMYLEKKNLANETDRIEEELQEGSCSLPNRELPNNRIIKVSYLASL